MESAIEEQKAWVKRMISKYVSLDPEVFGEDREWELDNAAHAIVEGFNR